MVDRVGASISFKVQVRQYEPLEVSAWAEIDVEPRHGDAKLARTVAFEKLWEEISVQVQDNLAKSVSEFKQLGGRVS